MKTRPGILKLLLILCRTVTTAAVFGRTTYVWTNQTPVNVGGFGFPGDLAISTNWSPNGVPRPDVTDGTAYGDEMRFDGRTTGLLAVTQNGSIQTAGAGSGQPYGLRIHLTSNQTNSVTIYSPVTISVGMRMNYFTIDAGTGSLVLGNHNPECLDIIAGVLNGQILGFTNNSSTRCVINESVRCRLGGAGAHPFVFVGSGDWIVNNRLRSAGSGSVLVTKSGAGTMTWTATNVPNSFGFDVLGTPITIGGGTMIWKSSDIVGGSAGNPAIVHNGTLFKYDAPVGSGTIQGDQNHDCIMH